MPITLLRERMRSARFVIDGPKVLSILEIAVGVFDGDFVGKDRDRRYEEHHAEADHS
jgi:hypothetical protein